jgi:hypothetical protein
VYALFRQKNALSGTKSGFDHKADCCDLNRGEIQRKAGWTVFTTQSAV